MNLFMELALCRALPHFTLSRRFYTASAACRPMDGDRRRTHPFDPLPPMVGDRFRAVRSDSSHTATAASRRVSIPKEAPYFAVDAGTNFHRASILAVTLI